MTKMTEITAVTQKDDLVEVVSSKKYRSQFFADNQEEVTNMITAAFEEADQVKVFDQSLRKAAQMIEQKVWNHDEAFRSGRSGYVIGVELNGNPFKGQTGDAWLEGWKLAKSKDTTPKRRIDYYASEERYDRNSKSRRDRNHKPENRERQLHKD